MHSLSLAISFIFTPEAISALVGFILMLFFAYFPTVRQWYAVLKSEVKSWIMLGLLLVALVTISLLSYYGVIATNPPFSLETALSIAMALLVGNQPTYRLLPEASDVKALRLARDAKIALALAKRNK